MSNDEKFYVALLKKNGKMHGHAWRISEPKEPVTAEDFAPAEGNEDKASETR
jgi:hypothetical protein